jgi:hypothetical protein
MMIKALLISSLIAFASADLCQAKNLVWKTEAELGSPVELLSCDPDKDAECPDFVPYKQTSKFGVNYYLVYHEGVRASIGFGKKDNQAWMGPASALHPGAFDWGGVERGGVFQPLYVIKRFYIRDWDDEFVPDNKTVLLVFRLRDDGASCVIDTKGLETNVNAAARDWAQRDLVRPECGN